jgi:hypothetical protein
MQLVRTLEFPGCPVNLLQSGQMMNVKIRLGANLENIENNTRKNTLNENFFVSLKLTVFSVT